MDNREKVSVVVLAAGEGTRMKSNLAKVLHRVCGKTMIRHVLDTVEEISPDRVVVVVGHQADFVKGELNGYNVEFALQKERLGTAHAVLMAEPFFEGYDGNIIVLNGDTPLLKPSTLIGLIDFHRKNGSVATVLTAELDDPSGYGRIVRDEKGELLRIVEDKDADDEEKQIKEINSGLFCFDAGSLFPVLHKVDRRNVQGEYYLTDAIEIFRNDGKKVSAFLCDQKEEVLGVNTVEQLKLAERLMNCDG